MLILYESLIRIVQLNVEYYYVYDDLTWKHVQDFLEHFK